MGNDQRGDAAGDTIQPTASLLVLSAAAVPPELAAWLDDFDVPAVLTSVERLGDGQVVLQAIPAVDPALVARIRKILAQHADVLRRLT